MLAFIIFIVLVAIAGLIAGLSIIKASVFSLVLFLAVLAMPIIFMLLFGLLLSPYSLLKQKSEKRKPDVDVAARLIKDARRGKVLGFVFAYLTYLIIVLVSYKLGRGFMWAAIVGILVKLIFDYMYGDLPFQQPKYATDEFGNKVSLKNRRN